MKFLKKILRYLSWEIEGAAIIRVIFIVLILCLYGLYLAVGGNYRNDFEGITRHYKPIQCKDVVINYSVISKQDILKRLESNPRRRCNCTELSRSVPSQLQDFFVESTCSDEATLVGLNQNVITFSLFSPDPDTWDNNVKVRYFDGIPENLIRLRELYPGWLIRVYTNVSFHSEVCQVVCSSEQLYFCDVKQLPQFGDVQFMNPTTWRFLVLGDPTVKVFASRDLDSLISQRERNAVLQWEKSAYPIHAMRDHPYHKSWPMLAGLWGGDNSKICPDVAREIQMRLMEANSSTKTDQKLLADIVYNKYRSQILRHDSYSCKSLNISIPFPTQRKDIYDFLGNVYMRMGNEWKFSIDQKCPEECRPVYGKSWEYC